MKIKDFQLEQTNYGNYQVIFHTEEGYRIEVIIKLGIYQTTLFLKAEWGEEVEHNMDIEKFINDSGHIEKTIKQMLEELGVEWQMGMFTAM